MRRDVCKQLDYTAMSAIIESDLDLARWYQSTTFRRSFKLPCHSRQGFLFWRILFPFHSRAKGVMHLFVSIKPKLKHKRRELRDQIAALGRTTGSFCRHTTQMTQCLSSVPMRNWRLWISYSTYFTYPSPAFFLPLNASLCYSLCGYRVKSHFFIDCRSGDLQKRCFL